MTGNGQHTTYKDGDLRDGLFFVFYPHYIVYINGSSAIMFHFEPLVCTSFCLC